MKYDIVIDIETLSTKKNATILSIGAVVFDRYGEPGSIIDSLEILLDYRNQPNRAMDIDTMLWWGSDSMKEMYDKTFNSKEERVRLGLGLKQLDDFIKEYTIREAWGCSPSFDMVILEDAYQAHNREFPVKFWKWSCIRTLENFLYGKNTRKKGGVNHIEGGAHDALEDCKMEALVVQKCAKALKDHKFTL